MLADSSRLIFAHADVPPFVGVKYDYEDLGDGCRKWTPTRDYLSWLSWRWPKIGMEEMIRLGWVRPGKKRWMGAGGRRGFISTAS
jgi:hypothetical protein